MKNLFTALALYLIFLLLRYPALSLEYASTGLLLWFQKMIPTLLPFMILSGIIIRMNLTEKMVRLIHPILHRIFKTSPNGSYTILMGFLCGFPMGARIIGELYESGKLDREESSLLLAFCNNIGPIYFLSYVVPTLGIMKPLVPFCIMYGVPLAYGFVMARFKPTLQNQHSTAGPWCTFPNTAPMLCIQSSDTSQPAPSLLAAIDDSVLSGLIGIGKLGGYMVFFNLLNILFVPFQNVSPAILSLYNCILEITSGIDRASQYYFYPILILLPFGGFSCIAQTYSMIQHTDLSIRTYILHKVMQTILTALIYLFLSSNFL
jgi:sporulation integral membrane protein YlbJ